MAELARLTPVEALLTAIALAAMAGLAVTDARRFEVSPALVAVLAAAVLALLGLDGGPAAVADALLAAAVAGGAAWLVTVLRPGKIGPGDIWLVAALGLVAGTALLPLALALFLAGCLLTAAAWSVARGKRLLRSMFPGAIPAMGAAAPVLVMRTVTDAPSAVLLAAALAAPWTAAGAETVHGPATVTAGGTAGVGGQRIRPHGTAAPERDQACRDAAGTPWRCGMVATGALEDMPARGRYGRGVGRCAVDGVDPGAWTVAGGHAVASRRYGTACIGEETRARRAGHGFRAGSGVMPWDRRRGWDGRHASRRGTCPRADHPGTVTLSPSSSGERR